MNPLEVQKSSPPNRWLGQTVSHYQILALLGEGGMGQVFRARDTRLARDVALKMITPALASDPDRIKRFEQEARAAGALNHPNIVAVHDVGIHEGSPFVVMELLEGETLRHRLQRGPMPVRKACGVAAQVARGLAAAHEKGIVHRDIKPENLFLTKDGRLKILDFGVAKLTRPDTVVPSGDASASDSLTGSGAIIGTSGYLSPEQARGQPADHRSDLFALGTLLYEMLTGVRAFHRDSFVETLHAVLREEPPPLSAARGDIPATLEVIVRRCLEKNPGERFQSAGDLAFALEELSGSIPVHGEVSKAAHFPRRRTATRRQIAICAACTLAVGLAGLVIGRLAENPARIDLDKYRLTPLATSLAVQKFPSWSPDGKAVAFWGKKSEGESFRIWIQKDGDVTPVPVTEPSFQADDILRLLWSPDSRVLYSSGDVGGKGGLYRIPVGGGDPILLQPDPEAAPALSPDGRTLTWLAPDSSGTYRLWFASPPDAPRRLYWWSPSMAGGPSEMAWAGFSPDGSKLLIFVSPLSGPACWLLPWPPGKGHRVFSARDVDWPYLSWLPDSRHVVFSMFPDSAQPCQIRLGDTRTGRVWPVFVGAGFGVINPSVSPDGRRIAFTSPTWNPEVAEVPIEGGPIHTLIASLRAAFDGALSSDGKAVIYQGNARGPWEVRLRDLSTGTDRLVATPNDYEGERVFGPPALSRDGRRYAVTINSKLFVGLIGGGVAVRATTEPGIMEYGGSWSPDGTALTCLRDDSRMYVALIRPGGSGPPGRLLEASLGALGNPEWSPTGEWIAVANVQDHHLILVSPDGRKKQDLPARAGWQPGSIGWSPDGRLLYVVESCADPDSSQAKLVSIEVKTGRRREIRDLGRDAPSQLGTSERLSVTPDGRSLVYSIDHTNSEIWTLEGLQLPKPWYARLLP